MSKNHSCGGQINRTGTQQPLSQSSHIKMNKILQIKDYHTRPINKYPSEKNMT